MEKFNYLEFLSKECKTEIATADFISQLMMNKVYEKGFKDACLSSEVIPISVLEDIKSEIIHIVNEESGEDEKWARGLHYSLKIIDKHCEKENTDGSNN